MAELRVILVDPLYEGNVGHVARSMMNFGTTDLAFVDGCQITNEGRDRAVHAQKVLDAAPRFTSLRAAGEGCDLLVGFTARMTKREQRLRRNPVDLRDWAPQAAAHPGRIGLVFGREDRGLTNEDADLCDVLVAVPTHEMYRSMNLAHAVTVALYAVHAESDASRVKQYTPAPKDLVDRLLARVEVVMQMSDVPEHKRPMTLMSLRRVLGRSRATNHEVLALLGMFRDTLYHLGVRRERSADELPPALRDGGDLDLAAASIAHLLHTDTEDVWTGEDDEPDPDPESAADAATDAGPPT